MVKMKIFVIATLAFIMIISCGNGNSSNESTEVDYYSEVDDEEFNDSTEPYNDSFVFNTSQDVMAYLIGKRFYSEDYYIEVNTDGIYMNGQCMSLAPMITDFYESTAFIMANTPTNGRFRFSVDANNGTVTDENSGEVYYLK